MLWAFQYQNQYLEVFLVIGSTETVDDIKKKKIDALRGWSGDSKKILKFLGLCIVLISFCGFSDL